jgi:hypothetical protein
MVLLFSQVLRNIEDTLGISKELVLHVATVTMAPVVSGAFFLQREGWREPAGT